MIDYARELNPAQLEAVNALEGPVLVIAGAGSGKTRTIIFRLARLVESGVAAANILLLTFTRKAAREMIERAANLTGRAMFAGREDLRGVSGGTFHSYAYSVLRVFSPPGFARGVTILDAPDSLSALQHCKENLNIAKGDKSFPKIATVQSYLSKSRNKEESLEHILGREASHLLPFAEDLERIAAAYAAFKREKSLLDYDDLLFSLEETLRANPEALAWCHRRHSHIMVDEYQDTNLVQARLISLLASSEAGSGNVLAVGDDAQSIYAFRGATVRNILQFPAIFPGTRIIRLEENYRSTQPVLDLANAVLQNAAEGYKKHLFTRRSGGESPRLLRPFSDLSQADLVAQRIRELLRIFPANEIAVLFRAAYQSYHLEVQLNKAGLRFKKYGGVRFSEAAHIKDILAYLRLILNPLDLPAFQRLAAMSKGIGPKTALKLYAYLQLGDKAALQKGLHKYPALAGDLALVENLRSLEQIPASIYEAALLHFSPRLEELYPDDWPRRMQGLEEIRQIAAGYAELDLFLADLCLEGESAEEAGDEAVTLSTIHSAKGLEWSAVIILDLVEGRFPSRHALNRAEDFEEERRLLYVACTRARSVLDLSAPVALRDRASGLTTRVEVSPFVREIPLSCYEEWQEGFSGRLVRREAGFSSPGRERPAAFSAFAPLPDEEIDAAASVPQAGAAPAVSPANLGYCRHRIFGRGKIVQALGPDKYKVNFPGLGLKVILAAYLSLEE